MRNGILIVCVEGNIGSGKSTLLQRLLSAGFAVFPEDVAAWEPFLEKMYNGATRQSDLLQLRILADHARLLRAVDALDRSSLKTLPDGRPVVFVERWVGAAEHVFMRHASQADHLSLSAEGRRLWEDCADLLGVRRFEPDAYVYVEVDPRAAHARMAARASHRASERNVPFEYLEALHVLYTDFVNRLEKEGAHMLRIQNENNTKESFETEAVNEILARL